MNDFSNIDRGKFHEELVEFSNLASQQNYHLSEKILLYFNKFMQSSFVHFVFKIEKNKRGL